jgi:hypothetical protein
MRKPGLAIQIRNYLAKHGAFPGKTRGEIRDALGLPPDTEVTARLRELRDRLSYGNFRILVFHDKENVYRYWMTGDERQRAQDMEDRWLPF